MIESLEHLRAAVSRGLIFALWGLAAIVAGTAWWDGRPMLVGTLMAGAVALGATLVAMPALAERRTRVTVSAALMVMVSLVLAGFGGSSWQIDIHMAYFAALAIVSLYADVAVIVVATTLVALHHLGLNFIAPALVFPQGGDFGRVVLHAVILLCEAGALGWMAYQINGMVDTCAKLLEQAALSATAARDSETMAADQRLRAEAERAAREQQTAETSAAQSLVVQTVATHLGRLADGDLTCAISTAFAADYEPLRLDFNGAIGQLHDIIAEIVSAIDGIGTGTGEIAQAANDLSSRTEQQAARLEQTAAALGAINATVRRSAVAAQQAGQAVGEARASAGQSDRITREAVSAMGQIESSAAQIGQIIAVIDGIAFQTNLLALNAGVEAARAGDAGRGFAVVASEVRALAQRSAEAAKEIKTLIEKSTSQIGRGVGLVGETGTALNRIVEQVAAIDQVVGEISNSAKEQATGLAEVNAAIRQMDQVTQQNAAMVEQTTAASTTLAEQAQRLSSLTARLRIGGLSAAAAVTGHTPARMTRHAASASPPPPRRAPAKPALKVVAASRQQAAAEDWREF